MSQRPWTDAARATAACSGWIGVLSGSLEAYYQVNKLNHYLMEFTVGIMM
jgi:hypothetical protein